MAMPHVYDGMVEAAHAATEVDPHGICDPPSDEEVETILTEAARLTSGPRQRDYDHPHPNHGRIAAMWNAYVKCRKHPESDLDGEDVARMMILLKIARDVFTPKRDSLVDIAGYARCIERMRAVAGDGNYAE